MPLVKQIIITDKYHWPELKKRLGLQDVKRKHAAYDGVPISICNTLGDCIWLAMGYRDKGTEVMLYVNQIHYEIYMAELAANKINA